MLISARTDDWREVRFRHDEIRDWYGNVRLDRGYALTIAAAQGLTVDRTFVLADDRPARETIYPAATRLGVPGRDRPCAEPALRDAAAESPLHRRHARQAAGGVGGPAEGGGRCGAQRVRTPALVEAGQMAGP